MTLSGRNNWTASLTVPKYSAGNEIGYQWIEPNITGYTQTGYETNGTATVITNRTEPEKKPVSYTLTIRYRDTDGNGMAEDYTGTYQAGDLYSIDSPVIPGYMTSTPVVAGVMPSQDRVVTVIYVKEAEPEVPPTEPETPLAEPETPPTEPDVPPTEPEVPLTEPETPQANPENPQTDPENPQANPNNPETNPDNPPAEPEEPEQNNTNNPGPIVRLITLEDYETALGLGNVWINVGDAYE